MWVQDGEIYDGCSASYVQDSGIYGKLQESEYRSKESGLE